MNIRCLIVDDNAFIIRVLSDMLNEAHPQVHILDTADSGASALSKIEQYRPDLIFLDVELPDMTGFEVLARLDHLDFQVIFITSHSHYAIRAIRFNALDYLLKPFDHDELDSALKRYLKYADSTTHTDRLRLALKNLELDRGAEQILFLDTQEGELRLPLKSIVKIQGERNYSYIFLIGKRRKLSSKTLGYFEEILSHNGFFRCHRSFLVNGFHVKDMQVDGHFRLGDESKVPISRRKKSEAKRWYQRIAGDGSVV